MDLFKNLKKLITLFENLKKLDPVDYYARGMDKKFQEQVIEFASQQDIQDPDLLNTLDYASKSYWPSSNSWASWQAYGSGNGSSSQNYESNSYKSSF